jgi:hypothetical protein
LTRRESFLQLLKDFPASKGTVKQKNQLCLQSTARQGNFKSVEIMGCGMRSFLLVAVIDSVESIFDI